MQSRTLDQTGLAKPGKTRGLTGTGPGLDRQEAAGRVLGPFWNQTKPFFQSNLGPLEGYPDPLLTLVRTSGGIMWNRKCISPTTSMIPDILHTIYLGMFKHFIDWVTSCLEQHSGIDKFNPLWAIMPPYPGFA